MKRSSSNNDYKNEIKNGKREEEWNNMNVSTAMAKLNSRGAFAVVCVCVCGMEMNK